MRNNDHDGTEAFHYDAANCEAMNAHAGPLFRPERRMREAMTGDPSDIAAQLIEAACKARDGDLEAAREYIAHAVTLLHGKCLRTGAVRGLLSRREAGILQMIPRGMSNKCIAGRWESLLKQLKHTSGLS
jgi:hypothetical protein